MKTFIAYTYVLIDATHALGIWMTHARISGTVRLTSCARHTISMVTPSAFAPVTALHSVVNALRVSVTIVDQIAGRSCSVFDFTGRSVANISGSALAPEAAGVVRVGHALGVRVAVHLEARGRRSAIFTGNNETSIASADVHITLTVNVTVRVFSTVRTPLCPAFIAVPAESRLTSAHISLYCLLELTFGVRGTFTACVQCCTRSSVSSVPLVASTAIK